MKPLDPIPPLPSPSRNTLAPKVIVLQIVLLAALLVAKRLDLARWGYAVMYGLFLSGLILIARADYREYCALLDEHVRKLKGDDEQGEEQDR